MQKMLFCNGKSIRKIKKIGFGPVIWVNRGRVSELGMGYAVSLMAAFVLPDTLEALSDMSM